MTFRVRMLLVVALGFAGILGAGAARAEGDALAAQALANTRARYAAVRDVHATFEGTTAILGSGTQISGRIAYHEKHASLREIRFEKSGNTVLVLREGPRLRRWNIRKGERVLEADRLVADPIEVPLLPGFDRYDESSVVLLEVRRDAGRPAVYVIEMRAKDGTAPFPVVRFGIEDGSWLVRTLDLLDSKGKTVWALRFTEMKIDAGVSLDTFAPPTEESTSSR